MPSVSFMNGVVEHPVRKLFSRGGLGARAVIAGARQEQERVSPDERSSDSSRAENPYVNIFSTSSRDR